MRFCILHALPIFAVLAGMSAATGSTITSVSTSGEGGVPCAGSTTCTSHSNGPNAGGVVTATAGLGFGVTAIVDATAVCSSTPFCLRVIGMADAEQDLTIFGSATSGVVVFQSLAVATFGSASTQVGLSSIPTNFGAGLIGYKFTFGQPFHLSAIATLNCTECQSTSTARITGFTIYDNDLEQLPATAPDSQGRILATVPEPGTWWLCIIGLLALAVRGLTRASSRSHLII